MKPFKQLVVALLLLAFVPTLSAGIKPLAVSYPIKFVDFQKPKLGEILQRHFDSQLSNYYTLKSQAEVGKALDAAASLISSEVCTEAACIKQAGISLGVDYMFISDIFQVDDLWEITVRRIEVGTDNTALKNQTCDQCSLI